MIRIAGGTVRGRNLEVPPGQNTRPTSAVVREAAFGMIQGRVSGSAVLDLFCGSGAYAFEALSRGAGSAVLIDSDAKAVSVAKRNAGMLGFADVQIYQNDFLRALQILVRNDKKFDIIFLDPPYASGLYQTAINESKSVLGDSGCIVCEHPASMSIPVPEDFEILRQRAYGIRALSIVLRRNHSDRDLSGQL